MTKRRSLLPALPLLLAGCSVFPDRPNIPVRRYALDPRRAEALPAPRGAPVLQIRRIRGVPGLQDLGLRRARPDGSYEILPYEEWLAAPGDLAEASLRAWLSASGLFSAVVAPGSRAEPGLVLEGQLTVLEAAPAAGEARAALAGVLLREDRAGTRVAGSFDVSGRAPLTAGAGIPGEAAAMVAALGMAFTALEGELRNLRSR
jgi:ABC-type uncharacterized transport system auxiliary subunit